jgi:hypothetical protein
LLHALAGAFLHDPFDDFLAQLGLDAGCLELLVKEGLA